MVSLAAGPGGNELAWHAGISFWRGTGRINDASVGIELENRGWWKTDGVKAFAFEPGQIAALIPLAGYPSPATTNRRTWWHTQMSHWRKDDPGPLFPWARTGCGVSGLARSGAREFLYQRATALSAG